MLLSQRSQKVDSLLVTLGQVQEKTQRLDILIEISNIYNRDNIKYSECISLLEEANSIASKDSNFVSLAKIYSAYGVLFRNAAEYDKAHNAHQKALEYATKGNNKTLQASALNGIGVVFRRQDNHAVAAQYHIDALKLADEVGDRFNISVSINSLGNIYSLSGQYQEAMKYFRRGLKLSNEMGNKLGIAINLNNIGEAFEFTMQYDSALYYYSKSLEANKEIQSQKGIAISYNAIGKIKLIKGDIKEAYNLFREAMVIDKKLGDKKFIADSYINLGRAYLAMNRLHDAEDHLARGLQIAAEIGSISHAQWAYETLSEVSKKRGDSSKALELYQKSIIYRDSLINERNSRALAMIEVMYNTQKKEKEIELLLKNQEITEKELARQKIIQVVYLVGFIFFLISTILVYSALNIKRKANKVLASQKAEIERSNSRLNQQQQEILKKNDEINIQRNNIALKNKHLEEAYGVIENYIGKITDNIRYAERIQKAILSPLESALPFFADIFCYYKPKDFVSGDFYWINAKGDSIFIAVADCTGHGVPGAFMSIIGMDLLNQAINQQGINEPSMILDFLNIEVRKKLRKDNEEAVLKDSLDIGICRFDKPTSTLHFAGALIPLIILRNNAIIEVKASPVSIGISNAVYKKGFEQRSINVQKGDWLYLFSDGFSDQFGGERGPKFLRKRLHSNLIEINSQRGEQQRVSLERIFSQWKGSAEQIDDVLVLGFML
jgi:serine phosphatase RsbU (regulator of sigma subunit)